ncbi:MAG: carbamoyltransferase HypF, partial [Planctomycetota bacterium]
MRRTRLRIDGLVQGVGFRPFVHRTAAALDLGGWVRNTGEGVELEIEGAPARIEAFLAVLREAAPPAARVGTMRRAEVAPRGERAFRILASRSRGERPALVSPDLATCPACLRELDDRDDRRHGYPFLNCTDCGPRFTIVEAVPYDRARTSMRGFAVCPACAAEYGAPGNRRFHAEPNACPECGPTLRWHGPAGAARAEGEEALCRARETLAAGGIVAVKGLGGFHLAADGSATPAVQRLRELKERPHQPLAVMAADVETVRRHCRLSAAAERHLTAPSRPILLLTARACPRDGAPPLSPAVAPGALELGVMLPYTPLHHLLFAGAGPRVLVLTSANRRGEPMAIDDEVALARFGPAVDGVLCHDRRIVNRCDDSVGQVRGSRLVLLRRSRGIVPLPVRIGREVRPTLALGALLHGACAAAVGRDVFLSPHLGDLDSRESLEGLREAVAALRRWLRVDFALVAHDLHPDLPTTRLARELAGGARCAGVQHHHAHFASALAAAGTETAAIGLVLDGTGWGPDGTIWGGEILAGTAASVRRAGHLLPIPLPGGDAAIRRPLRLALAFLAAFVPDRALWPRDLLARATAAERAGIPRMVETGLRTAWTSSAGRLFDVVAALLGVRDEITYEGQAAIELERLARAARGREVPALAFELRDEREAIVLDPRPFVADCLRALAAGVPRPALAAGFHRALARALAAAAARVR